VYLRRPWAMAELSLGASTLSMAVQTQQPAVAAVSYVDIFSSPDMARAVLLDVVLDDRSRLFQIQGPEGWR